MNIIWWSKIKTSNAIELQQMIFRMKQMRNADIYDVKITRSIYVNYANYYWRLAVLTRV